MCGNVYRERSWVIHHLILLCSHANFRQKHVTLYQNSMTDLSKVAKQYVFAVVKYRVVFYYLWWAVSFLNFTCQVFSPVVVLRYANTSWLHVSERAI
jgi:hypothetical protein